MIAQTQTKRPAPPQLKLVVSPVQPPQNNDNWLYAGTDEAWLYTDYRQLERDISTEVETTAYKLPQYPEDLDCFTCTTPKTNEQILDELKTLDPEWIEF